MTPIGFLGVGLSALVLTFGVGYVMLRAYTDLDPDRSRAFSGLAGTAAIAGMGFVAFLTPGASTLGIVVAGILLASSAGLVAHRRNRLVVRSAKIMLEAKRPHRQVREVTPYLIIVAVWLIALCTQLLITVYGRALQYGDWWMHFDVSKVYPGLQSLDATYFDEYTVPSRTPLFNLYEALFLRFFGAEFYIYQLTAIVPAIACLAACLTLVDKAQRPLFGVLVGLNAFVSNQIAYPWPKMLAAGYVIVLLLSLLELQRGTRHKSTYLGLAGIAGGLAILSHPSAVIYFGTAAAVYLWSARHAWRRGFSDLLVLCVLAGAVVVPWLLWAFLNYGPERLLAATPTAAAQHAETLRAWLGERVFNIRSTFLPVLPSRVIPDPVDAILRTYYATLPGAVTLTITVVLALAAVRRKIARVGSIVPITWAVAVLVAGVVGGVVLQPGTTVGVASESMTPIVLVWVALATGILGTVRATLRLLAIAAIGIEFGLSRGVQLLLISQGEGGDPGNLLLKSAHQLVFARDDLDTLWIAVTAVMLIAAVVWLGTQGVLHSLSEWRSPATPNVADG